MVLNKTIFFVLFFTSCFQLKAIESDMDLHDFHYRVDMELKEDKNIFGTLKDVISESAIASEIKQLRLFTHQNESVNNMRSLNDRITNDVTEIHKKAHMLGFYGTEIRYKIHLENHGNVRVEMYVDLGTAFNLKLNIKYINQDQTFNEKYGTLLQAKLRMFKASFAEIKSLINCAVDDLQKDGFFEPKVIEKRVHINYELNEAVLNLTIDPGQKVYFSDIKINAFPRISKEFINNRIKWSEGDLFDIEKLLDSEENLKNSQIFSSVKISPDKTKIVNDKIPMIIDLEEDKKHTVDFSLLYSGMRNMNFEKKSQTQKKLKSILAMLSWTNYNAFGSGEKLNFAIEGTPMKVQDKRVDYGFEAGLSQPDVLLKDNTAYYLVSRKQELTNVFFRKSDKCSLIFNYLLVDTLLISSGAAFEKNYIDGNNMFFQNPINKNYEDFAIPLEFTLDETDDLLNPTSGYRAYISFSRMFFRSSSINSLASFDIGFSYNYSLDDLKKTILAFNFKRKSIVGKNIDDIPIDKRLYGGGIGSARGYANQMATEMVIGAETPIGGKSLIEFNSEIRRKFTTDFGAVVFFDGAKVFQNKSSYNNLQTEKKRWFFSAGVGIRYFTAIGPIRIDFAFPIKRRKGIDSRMQFIISLGQAF